MTASRPTTAARAAAQRRVVRRHIEEARTDIDGSASRVSGRDGVRDYGTRPGGVREDTLGDCLACERDQPRDARFHRDPFAAISERRSDRQAPIAEPPHRIGRVTAGLPNLRCHPLARYRPRPDFLGSSWNRGRRSGRRTLQRADRMANHAAIRLGVASTTTALRHWSGSMNHYAGRLTSGWSGPASPAAQPQVVRRA